MKIEIDFDDATIQSAVRTWTERATANALDAYLTGYLSHDVMEKTHRVVANEMANYLQQIDLTHIKSKIANDIQKYAAIYVQGWASREAARITKAELKIAAAKLEESK
jgi:hypothetical protein